MFKQESDPSKVLKAVKDIIKQVTPKEGISDEKILTEMKTAMVVD